MATPYDPVNSHIKPYLDLIVAIAGGTPGAGGVTYVNTNPKAYIDAEITAAGGTPTGTYTNTNALGYIGTCAATLTPVDPPDTTPPNTTITSGPSDPTDDNTPTFTFTSSEPSSTFEVNMDGEGWQAAVSPKTYNALDDGEHTFQVRAIDSADNVDPSPASQTFTIDTGTPPIEWEVLRDLSTYQDWDGILDSAPGSSITNVSDYIYINQPNPGERCEMQVLDDAIVPGTLVRYTWEMYITSDTQFDPSSGGQDTISQQHGDNQSGYGGGLTVRASDHELILRVKGGERLSASGSQRYEYESDGKGGGADGLGVGTKEPASNVECGTIQLDTYHTIQVTALWKEDWTGYVYVTLDGGDPVGVTDVPTFCEPADHQMFRVGWYSSDGPTPKRMRVRNAKIEVPA